MHGPITRTFGFLTLVAALATGCGGGKKWAYNKQVEGTVTVDGTPLAGVMVEFVPDDPEVQGPPSRGYTNESGHFRLKADNRKAGAVIAKHFVTVLPGRGADPQAGEDPAQAAVARARQKNPPVPACYKTVRETPLVVEVTEDKHTYELALKSNAAPRTKK